MKKLHNKTITFNLSDSLFDVQVKFVNEVTKNLDGNKSHASKSLGVTRRTVKNYVERSTEKIILFNQK